MKIQGHEVPRSAATAVVLAVATPVAVGQWSLRAAVLSLVVSGVLVVVARSLMRQAAEAAEFWYEASGERCGWCGDGFDPRISRFADYCSRWCAESDEQWEALGEIVERHRRERYEAGSWAAPEVGDRS